MLGTNDHLEWSAAPSTKMLGEDLLVELDVYGIVEATGRVARVDPAGTGRRLRIDTTLGASFAPATASP